MRRILCLSIAFVVAGASAQEVVYRSIADDGTVTYSDRPTAGAEPVTLSVPRAALRAAARQGRDNGSRSDAGDRTAGEGGARRSAEPPGPSAAERAEQRRRNCQAARDRAERYNGAHRLYRELENGEREYLDDDEIDEARAQAAADVETWCD